MEMNVRAHVEFEGGNLQKFWKIHLILWWQERAPYQFWGFFWAFHQHNTWTGFRCLCLFLINPSPLFSNSGLTSLLCGKQNDEGNDDDEEQGDDGNEPDLQGGPAGLLSRLGWVGLCHSQVSSFSCRLYQLTWGERENHTHIEMKRLVAGQNINWQHIW